MSGKRYGNVSESSSDEECGSRYKSSCSSNEKFNSYEDDCSDKALKKKETSSSSFEMTKKRGKGDSKRPCMNKNAQAARENRIRKKKHLEQVEHKLLFYQQKTKSLVNIIQKQDIDIKKLKSEVRYLRCVLSNNTNITALLQSMNEGLSKTSNNEKLSKYRDSRCNGESANGNYNSGNEQRSLQSVRKTQLLKSNKVSNLKFDHTYTIPKTRSTDSTISNGKYVNEDDKHEKFENCRKLVFGNENLFEAAATSALSDSDELLSGNISETEMDEWPRLNMNIHNSFTNFDVGLDPFDLDKFTNLYDDSNVPEQFRDAEQWLGRVDTSVGDIIKSPCITSLDLTELQLDLLNKFQHVHSYDFLQRLNQNEACCGTK